MPPEAVAAGPPTGELQAQRRRGKARTSDADMLAGLTPFPGLFWVGVFLVVTVGALVLGSWWIGLWSIETLPRF